MSKKFIVDGLGLEMVLNKLDEMPRKEVNHIFTLSQEAVRMYEDQEDAVVQALSGMGGESTMGRDY